MPLIPYPNVPNVPGVPALLRSATIPTPSALFVQGIAALVGELFGREVWGIYNSKGKIALEADSFVSIDYQNGSRISNAPQEKGTFSSYNKVANPYDCSVVLTIGADKAARTKFLQKIEDIGSSVELYSVVTPERTYTNATLENFNYKRESTKGVTLITVQLNFVQIRNGATITVTKPREPSSEITLSNGQVSPIEPTDRQIELAGGAA